MNILYLLKDSQLKKVKIVNLNKNEILFQEDQKCDFISIIIEGEIKIVSYSFSGREIIYSLLKKDDIFGNNLIFSSSPFYKGAVVAKVNSKIALIDKDTLISLLQENKEFLLKYLSIIGDLTKNLNDKNKLLSFDKATERVLYYLHKNNNEIQYKTITNLAEELNIKRETLSRTLTKMSNDKLILVEKNIIKAL